MRELLTIFLVLSTAWCRAGEPVRLTSPNKVLTAELFLLDGQVHYRLQAGDLVLMDRAVLGMVADGRRVGAGVQAISWHSRRTIDEARNIGHRQQQVRSHSIEYVLLMQQRDITDTVVFRLFDGGCAFRYQPGGKATQRVQEELTSFAFPADARVWYFERNNSWKLKSYAGLWQHTTPDHLPTVSSQGPIQGKPLVAELRGNKLMVITEAALYGYSGMRLKAIGNNAVQVNFTEGDTGFAVNKKLITPWRVVLFANGLHELVNNTVIDALNPAPDAALFADRSWIKPGVAVWSWISRQEATYMQPAEEKRFIDAAAQLNFQYTLLDEGWETKWPDKWAQLDALCQYAATKKIGVWVWKHSKDLLDTVHRNRFLDSIRAGGAVGIKTDFMNSEDKGFIDFEIGFLRACAQRQLLVNFHGCHAPTGERATWPNELTREGIRGMELNIMNEPIPAWHNAALPFTRFLCGHGDYTPAFFSNKANTTYTHQLALLYLFDSPFQCIAESPVELLQQRIYKPILPLLRTLPTTWDSTIVLPGSGIGTCAAFARRKGDTWYVAVINGTDQVMPFQLDPAFAGHPVAGKITVITDAPDGKGFATTRPISVKSFNTLFNLPAHGGLVIQIKQRSL